MLYACMQKSNVMRAGPGYATPRGVSSRVAPSPPPHRPQPTSVDIAVSADSASKLHSVLKAVLNGCQTGLVRPSLMWALS